MQTSHHNLTDLDKHIHHPSCLLPQAHKSRGSTWDRDQRHSRRPAGITAVLQGCNKELLASLGQTEATAALLQGQILLNSKLSPFYTATTTATSHTLDMHVKQHHRQLCLNANRLPTELLGCRQRTLLSHAILNKLQLKTSLLLLKSLQKVKHTVTKHQ